MIFKFSYEKVTPSSELPEPIATLILAIMNVMPAPNSKKQKVKQKRISISKDLLPSLRKILYDAK
jgi:hypothetical protein